MVLLAELSRFDKMTVRGTRTSPVTNARASLIRFVQHVEGRLETSTNRKGLEEVDEPNVYIVVWVAVFRLQNVVFI